MKNQYIVVRNAIDFYPWYYTIVYVSLLNAYICSEACNIFIVYND